MARSYVARELCASAASRVAHGIHHRQRQRVLDVHGLTIDDPQALETAINDIAGVVTVGLFAHRGADVILLGSDTGVETLDPRALRMPAMTNLNVPGLSEIADVAAYMRGVGEAARAAAREVARADTAAKDRALRAMATADPRRTRRRCSRPTHRTSRVPGRRATTRRSSTA